MIAYLLNANIFLNPSQLCSYLATEAARAVLAVAWSVDSRQSHGGTAPLRVREAIIAARLRYLGG